MMVSVPLPDARDPLLDLRRPDEFFWFAMIVLFLVLVWYTWLNRSTLGASFRAIKVNESKMKFLGYNTFVIRWTGFTLNCVLAALAGAMFAVNYGFVNPASRPGPCCGSSGRDPARGPEASTDLLGTVAFIGLRTW